MTTTTSETGSLLVKYCKFIWWRFGMYVIIYIDNEGKVRAILKEYVIILLCKQ